MVKIALLKRALAVAVLICGSTLPVSGGVAHASGQDFTENNSPTYADLADLVDASEIVLKAEIRKQAVVEQERSPGLKPGYVRLYIEARTTSLLTGTAPIGESLRYLVDLPLTAKGKAPNLRKTEVLLFARAVPGRASELQLVAPSAQLPWMPELEERLRPVLAEFVSNDAAPRIKAIRDAFSIDGNLAGESETQIFLETHDDGPVSLTVIRRPAQRPIWGVSWSEIVDQAARPPQMHTIDWYRLACFLPPRLPREANISARTAAQNRADADYQFILDELGPCTRNLDLMDKR